MDNPKKINRFSKEYFLYPDIMKEKENRYQEYQKEQDEICRKKLKMKRSIIESLEQKHNQNISDILQNQNFDINLIPQSSVWIPIQYFDNLKYENRTPEEWLDFYKLEDGQIMDIKGQMLHKNQKDNNYEWVSILVKGYNNKNNKWIIEKYGKNIEIQRIEFAFGAENKFIFAQRFVEAYISRVEKNQKLKQYFYINSMPQNEIFQNNNTLENNVLLKITQNANNKVSTDQKNYYTQIIKDHFHLIQNKIIFDNYAKKQGPKFLKEHELYLIYGRKKKSQDKNGILQLRKNVVRINQKNKNYEYPVTLNFQEKFSLFCIQSIYNENQYLKILQQIQQINLKVKEQNIFSLQNEETINFNTFKKLQENSAATFIGYCRSQWGKKIVNILEKHFEQFKVTGNNHINLQEENFNRFRNLLKNIDLIVQDCLEECIRKSFNDYVYYFEKRTPTKVEIKSPSDVITYYKDFEIKCNEYNNFKNKHKPLFQIISKISDSQIQIVESPQNFKNLITVIFQDTLNELSKFRKIEDQIINKNIESRMQKYIKIPSLVQDKISVDSKEKNKVNLFKDNLWLSKLKKNVQGYLQEQISPIIQYSKQFQQYNDILIIDSQQYLKQFFAEKNLNVEEINQKIKEIKETKNKIKTVFPDELQISCFLLNNQEMKEKVIQEYIRIEKGLTQKIEEIGMQMLNKIIQKNKILKNKIKKRPETIEQLAETRDFLQQGLYDQINDTKLEIQDAQKVFDILENNFVKITGDQIRNFWYVYGSCREIIELKKTIQIELKYQKETFCDELKQNQGKLNDEIQFVKQVVQNFINSNDVKQYETVYQESLDVDKQIDQLRQKSIQINEKEKLLKKRITQYKELEDIEEVYLYFQKFWKILYTWQNSHNCWLFNFWKDIDVNFISQFITDSLIDIEKFQEYINQNQNNYKKLLMGSEDLKKQLLNFQNYLPLITSLFVQYLQDRHWEEILSYTQIQMNDKDFDNLNLKMLLDKAFIKYQNFCIQINQKAKKEHELFQKQQDILQSLSNLQIKIENHKEYPGYFHFKNFDLNHDKIKELQNQVTKIKQNPYHIFMQEEVSNLEQNIDHLIIGLSQLKQFIDKWSQLKKIQQSTNLYKKDTIKAEQFREIDQLYLLFSSQAYQQPKIFKLIKEEFFSKIQQLTESLDNLIEWCQIQITE